MRRSRTWPVCLICLVRLTRTRTSRDKYELDIHPRALACCSGLSDVLAIQSILHAVCIATLLRWSSIVPMNHQVDSTSSCLVLHQWHHVLPGYEHISSTSRQHHLLPQHGPGLCVTLVGSTVHSSMIADRLGQWLHAVCSVQAWWHDAACPPTATKPRSLLSLYATIRRMSADTRTCTVI
jgi:hypothetical protein